MRFVPTDPFVAKRRTVLASHPKSQGMDPLRLGLGVLHRKVSETSRKTSVLLNQESGGSGGIISVVSRADSSTSTSSPWSDNTSKDPNQLSPVARFVRSLFLHPRNIPTLFPLGADLGVLCPCNLLACDQCVHRGNTLCQFYPSLLLCLCLDDDEI